MRFRSLSSGEVVVAEHCLPLDLSEFLLAGLMLAVALMGSFLRSFVKWPKKTPAKSQTVSEAGDEKERVQKQWTGKMVKIQVFPTTATPAMEAFMTQTHAADELLEFDPEKDYAQVLAEARSHLKQQAAEDSVSSSAPTPTFWLQSSQQLAVCRELEATWARETRSVRRWRSIFFWQRSKKHHETADRQDVNDFITSSSTSIFSTPQHPAFKPSRSHSCRQRKKGSSGPIYTDGLPSKPSHRPRKSVSGPLNTKLFFSGSGKQVPESPYQPLHHHHSSVCKSSSPYLASSLTLYTA